MKISDLERLLCSVKEKYGDLDVLCITPDSGGYDCMDDLLTVDLITVGKANDKPFEVGDCCNSDRPTVTNWLHIGQPTPRSDRILDMTWNKLNDI